MKLLRNIIYLFALLIYFVAGVLPRYRRHDIFDGFWKRLSGDVPILPLGKRVVWFHVAGVGELMLCHVVLERLRSQHRNIEFAITVFDNEALLLAHTLFPHDAVAIAPYDFTWSVRRALKRLQPSLFILAENDVWPNLIAEIGEAGIPIVIFNTQMNAREQREYGWNAWLIRPSLKYVSWWGVVERQDADWIEKLFRVVEPVVEVMGSLKCDGVARDKDNPNTCALRRLWGFGESEKILVAGSTHSPEEEVILAIYTQLLPLFPQFRLILVPRNSARFEEVAAMLNAQEVTFLRASRVSVPVSRSCPVTLVDTIGQLRDVWGLADLGFVGGTFSENGGHNLVEPASYGVPLCFGPSVHNVRTIAEELLNHGAVVQVTSVDDCCETLRRWLENPEEALSIGKKAQDIVIRKGSSLSVVLNVIGKVLPDDPLAT